MPILKWFLAVVGYYHLPISIRHRIFMWSWVVPSNLVSHEFKVQRRRLKTFYPHLAFRPHVIRVRDWGQGYSLALTKRFDVPIGQVTTGPHPEIIASMRGGSHEEDYYSQLVSEKNWHPDAAQARRQKTRRLLTQDPNKLFSEVQILEDGRLFIHDGYHRAAVRAGKGLKTAQVQITLNLFLR